MKIATNLITLAALMAATGAADARDLTAREQYARDLYETVIGFRTAYGHGQVPAMVEYLVGELRKAGFDDADIEVTDYDSAGEMTQGLIVTYHGAEDSDLKPIVFLGHMDVVDALPEDWERPPFSLVEEDGYFFGRGTLDNKYGITNLTQTFIHLKKSGFKPSRDLVLVFSGDEETGMISTRAQAAYVAEAIDPAFVLNSDAGGALLNDADGSPNFYAIQAAEKTYATWEMTLTNPGGHSSRPRADNAIYELADALKAIQAYQFPVRHSPITLASFEQMGRSTPGPLGKAAARFAADPTDAEAIATLRANPSTVGMTGTTCVATMLKAGHAENALPQSATATINCRIFPGEGADATLGTLKQVVANDAVSFKLITDVTEAPASAVREDVRAALEMAIADRYPGMAAVPYQESGGTDGMHYRALGYDTVAISGGAIKPSEMFAHGLNERLPVKSFYEGLTHWDTIIRALASPPPAVN